MIAELKSTIGIIGDVHAEDRTLSRVLDFFKTQQIESIVCVGDIVDGRGDVDACVNMLKEHHVITVLGNHDEWILENQMRDLKDATTLESLRPSSIEFLQSLPTSTTCESLLGNVLLCHGLNDHHMSTVKPDDMGYAIDNNMELQKLIARKDIQICICGHSHYKMVRKFVHVTIINAGTLYREHQPCFAVADLKNRQLIFYEIQATGEFIETKPITLL